MSKRSGSTCLAWWSLGVLLLVGGCPAPGGQVAPDVSNTPPPEGVGNTPPQAVLRVGMTPNYPPVVFQDHGTLTGLEPDFARALGEELGRRIVFVELAWDALIPALEAGQIDVIMSGMSVTEARQRRVRFVQPYLQAGQRALTREDYLLTVGSPSLLSQTKGRVGFVAETTGAMFVQANFSQAQLVAFTSVDEGIEALRTRAIDVFVHDAPTIWYAENNPAHGSLVGLYWPLTEEYLAWAVRSTDAALHAALEEVLTRWKRTNRLQAFFNTWLKVQVQFK
jgi:ABC-type amino acid transport substrate-binding protein